MASAKQRKAAFISNKLKFLIGQGDDLISAVGHYVNRIIFAGDSWTQGGDNNMEFQELCLMIEYASLFLCEKCQELADLSSQSITATASTPATSDRQPAAPLASTATTSYRQSTESVQPADGAHTKPLIDRIAVIEEAMCSFRGRTEKVVEQQSGIDQQMKELLYKLSESDKKNSSRFKQVKQQISDISQTRDAIEQDQKTRLQSLQKLLQNAELRDDNVTKLSQLIQEVAVMSPRLQQLEMKSPGIRCEFTVWKWLTEESDNSIIRQYETTKCNVGENFNSDSGIFTAPVDGLYVAAISLYLSENEHVSVGVQYQQSLNQGLGTEVCWSSAVTKQTNTCNVGVVDMKAGEVLYLRVYHMVKNNSDKPVYFSCFLLR